MLALVPASADDEGTSTDEREVGTYPTYEEALFSFNDAGAVDRMITSFVVIVQDLLTRPHWRRMWIVQETILATNLELQYGRHRISWNRFICWCNWIQDLAGNRSHTIEALHSCNLPIIHAGLFELDGYRHRKFNSTRLMLSDLLQAFGEIRECSDPRDPLISLLGLTEESAAK